MRLRTFNFLIQSHGMVYKLFRLSPASDHRALALKFSKKSFFLTKFQISKPKKHCTLGFTIFAWSKNCPAQIIKHGP